MTQCNATLVIDFGNSETRCIVLCGKDANTGKARERSFTLSNRFGVIDEKGSYTPSADYSEDTTTVLNLEAVVDGSRYEITCVNGEAQLREYNVAPMRPTALEKKYNTGVTALSYELAMLYAHRAVQKITRVSDIKSLDVTWTVVALLPPGDLDFGKTKMADLLKSVTEVNCSYPDVRIPIKVNKILVLPEGFCAFIGTVFDRGRVIRPNMSPLLKETVLVFDIGAGTTDILIVKDNKVISNSKHTIKRGGNNVMQGVRRELRDIDIILSETDVAKGIIDGFVRDGSKVVDIRGIINTCKDEIARYLVADMQSYLEETEIPIRSIGKLLVCGGGAIGGEGYATKSLGESIIAYLKRLSPNVDLIEMPEVAVSVTDEEGIIHKSMEKISPRELNILGASVMAEMATA